VSPLEPYAANDIKRKKRKNPFERDTLEEDALKMITHYRELAAALLKEHELKRKNSLQNEK